jgi:ribonuclease BN (tRNA processing enzyme)
METGNSVLLFDCGAGTMRRLMESGKEIFDVSHLFLSHFHPDHCGELASFLFSNKYPDGTRRTRELTLGGAAGTMDFFEKLKGVFGPWIELSPNIFSVLEMDNQQPDMRRFEDFTLHTAPVCHNPESIAFRIESPEGVSVVYSGDTDYSQSLIELASGADLMICECSLPDAVKVTGHLTPSLAGDMAAKAGVRKLVLTHFYPECDDADIVSECRRTYSGPLILAADLMRIHAILPDQS